MIVYLKCRTFEYDVHSLVKAFYPLNSVKIEDEPDSDESGCFYIVTVDPLEVPLSETDAPYSGILKVEYYESGSVMESAVSNVAGLNRAELKNAMKQLLYRLLAKVTRKELPWGTLTGIRPCKIPMKMLEEGSTDDEIEKYMKDTYFVSDEKIALSMDIAKREKNVLASINASEGYSLYVGIPFCPTRCMYCSFTSYPIDKFSGTVMDYLEALKKEISYVSEAFKDKTLDSVYIGGGTPTSISAEYLGMLITVIKESFDFSTVKEFTVEAGRPDSITEEKLSMLKDMGVTRISINPQTMNQKTLDVIGRRHTIEQIKDAFALARKCGHDNINMDIILGLPGEGEEEVSTTLSEIKKLGPDSLTVHSMAIKRAANMHEYLSNHPEIESVNTPEMMHMTEKCAKEMGMNPYYLYRQKNMSGNFENVGYTTPGKEGIYNILIMEEVQTILAVGAGTVTKRVYPDGRIERCDNVKDVNLYISKIEEMIDRKRELFAD